MHPLEAGFHWFQLALVSISQPAADLIYSSKRSRKNKHPVIGWLVGWLGGCLPACLPGWLVGWLAGCLAGLVLPKPRNFYKEHPEIAAMTEQQAGKEDVAVLQIFCVSTCQEIVLVGAPTNMSGTPSF